MLNARRVAALLMGATLVVSACGGSTPSTAPATAAPTTAPGATDAPAAGWDAYVASLKDKYAGKEIRVISIEDPFIPAMQATAAKFTELTGAKVIIDAFGYDAVYQKEQLACQQNSAAYDVIVLDVP